MNGLYVQYNSWMAAELSHLLSVDQMKHKYVKTTDTDPLSTIYQGDHITYFTEVFT